MLSWQIAQRFRRGKQKNRFISFVSFSSTLGVGLGCFVLITLLSVMNGFEKELKDRFLAVIPHGELYALSAQGIEQWQAHQQRLQTDPRIKRVEPYTKLTGMIQAGKQLKSVELTGFDVASAEDDAWRDQVSVADWTQFKQQEKGVLLGAGIMKKLQLKPGDIIRVLVPSVTQDLTFSAPKSLHLVVSGSIKVGGELDNLVGMMHLELASETAGIVSGAQGLRFTLYDPFTAYTVMRDIGFNFPQAVYMSDWTRTQGHLYDDIKLVRSVVYIALTLVIAVACFNIVSTLVMAVREKRAAIAILKTMGASDALIRKIFVFQGMTNGLIGIVVGSVAAVIIAPRLSVIVAWVESMIGVQLLSSDIYFIDFLPSDLHWMDVFITVSVALLLCMLATLYPAQRATKISPARALNR
jgi:lipoprotein-releasing system permease protein